MAKGMMKKAKENARAAGRDNLPPNYGDIILEQEKSNPATKATLAKARKEGATDADIRQLWNLHELERQMVLVSDDIKRTGVFVQALQQGMMPEEAAKEVRRMFPMYGDADDTQHTEGDDRPLPLELKDRVNRWVVRMAAVSPEKLKVPQGKTLNAKIRAEMRAGRL